MQRAIQSTRRSGAVLLLVLMALALTSLMGLYSVNMTIGEQQAANAVKTHVALYAIAEAGIDHAVAMLMGDFADGNAVKLKAGGTADWDFVVDGSYYGSSGATYYYCEDCLTGSSIIDGTWTSGGIDFVTRTTSIGTLTVTYTVTIWDNLDYNNDVDTGNNDIDPIDDTDGVIIVRSLAEVYGSSGNFIARAMHEATLAGTLSNAVGLVSGSAQGGSGSGKAGASGDENAVSAIDLTSTTTL